MAFGDLVQSAQNSGVSGNASATYPGATTSGNLLIFGVARSVTHAAGGAWGTPAGFTLLEDSGINTGNMGAAWFYKIAAGTEGAISLAGTNEAGNWRAVVLEYEGPFHASSPFDQSTENTDNLSATTQSQATGTTGITAQLSCLALAFIGGDQAANFDTGRSYTNSFVEDIFADAAASIARAGIAVASRVLTEIGNFSTTMTTTDVGDEMYGSIGIFRAAVTGSSPSVVLNTADATAFDTDTPTLQFTGTDADGDDIRYQIQISNNGDFVDSGVTLLDSYEPAANFALVHTQPTGTPGEIDDRPGGSLDDAGGGPLNQMDIHIGSDVPGTDGNAIIRIYAHQGVYGTSSEPLNPADPGDTPTPGALATSDAVPLTAASTAQFRTFTFSGANRIHLVPNTNYVWIPDWLPNDAELGNYVVIQGSTDLGHAGNTYNDGNSVANNGITLTFDMSFRIYSSVTTLSKLSHTDTGFARSGDSDPFASGQQVNFTVQAGDALEDGTYYWRVRGLDPAGSGAFGAWTSSRSFTVTDAGGGSPATPLTSGERQADGGLVIPVILVTATEIGPDYKLENKVATPVQAIPASTDRPIQGGPAIPVYVLSQEQIDSGEYRMQGGGAIPVINVALTGLDREVEGNIVFPVFVVGGTISS